AMPSRQPAPEAPPPILRAAPTPAPPEVAGETSSSRLLDEATAYLDRRELAAARLVLERARAESPGDGRAAVVAERLRRHAGAPEGLVYVDVDPTTAAGVYVRRGPVTNREYLAF